MRHVKSAIDKIQAIPNADIESIATPKVIPVLPSDLQAMISDKEYVCKDGFQNVYVFKATGVKEYKVELDTYTISYK